MTAPADLRTAVADAERALLNAQQLACRLRETHPRRYENIVGGIDAARASLQVSKNRWLKGSAS